MAQSGWGLSPGIGAGAGNGSGGPEGPQPEGRSVGGPPTPWRLQKKLIKKTKTMKATTS